MPAETLNPDPNPTATAYPVVRPPSETETVSPSWSWYVRGAFGAWSDADGHPDPRLHRLSGTDFCLRLCARDAPRLQPHPDGHTAVYDARHWHLHAGSLVRSSGQHNGWSAAVHDAPGQTFIELAGTDPDFGRVSLTLALESRDGDFGNPAQVAVLMDGDLRCGDRHRLGIRRATARSLSAPRPAG